MKYIVMGAAGAALATAATIGSVAPAQAAPIAAGNLVNVQITNLLNDNEVAIQIPINAAANICVGDVTVAVIAEVLDAGDAFVCTARSGNQELVVTLSTAPVGRRPAPVGCGPSARRGLTPSRARWTRARPATRPRSRPTACASRRAATWCLRR